MTKYNKGFTLVELSIVLVIIGLIIGGVLVGQDLINAASIRAQLTQIEKYNTAVATFYVKYGSLPGDMKDPKATRLGFIPRGAFAGQGDGNKTIEGVNANAAASNSGWWYGAGESTVFWVDLSKAELIEGAFSAASSTVVNNNIYDSTTPALKDYFPISKIADNAYIYIWSRNGQNKFCLQAITNVTGSDMNGPYPSIGISPNSAFAIDSKVDDGVPHLGRVKAENINVTPHWAQGYFPHGNSNSTIIKGYNMEAVPAADDTCFDNNNVYNAEYRYSVGYNGGTNLTCPLSFRMKGT